MYDRILIPLDGSESGEASLPYADLIPSRLVYLLCVEAAATGGAGRMRPVPAQPARAYLERIAARFRRQGREVETIVLTGDPVERILETAADVDLIVMATHGRGAVGRALRGGVADAVARQASAPALVVRAAGRAVGASPVTRLVVPLDGSTLAEEALPVALQLGEQLGVGVHLVRVVEPPLIWEAVASGSLPGGAYDGTFAGQMQVATTYLDDTARRIADRQVDVTTEARYGGPAPELLSTLTTGDLVVMTSHGRGGIARWFVGSVAEALVREAPVPVLLVQSGLAAGIDAAAPAVSVVEG